MKKLSLALFLCIIWTSAELPAQSKLFNKVKKKVDNRFNRKVDKGIDKGLDKVEKGLSDGDIGKENTPTVNNQGNTTTGASDPKVNSSGQPDQKTQPEPPPRAYSGFSFEEGIHTIFEFTGEPHYGEFPSKFGLIRGGAENAQFGTEDVISFIERGSEINPLMETKEYLPESWTMVFDAYYYLQGNEAYTVNFRGSNGAGQVYFRSDKAFYKNFEGTAKEGRAASREPGWRRYSISFNKRALKVYIDQNRVLNIPNIEEKLTSLSISALSPSSTLNATSVIKNIRIAEGGEKLYDQLVTDSKIVTNDILFEVDKAALLSESLGIINSIVSMMKKRPEVNFTIVGHTDEDGDDAYNQELSEQRAAAVKDEMIRRGVEAARLRSEGKGESEPIASNSTADGKAQNRRVEFIPF